MNGIPVNILPCKCGDFPRIRTNGGSYVHLYCGTCGYESAPFLGNTISDVIKTWNDSDRDRVRQKQGAKAFDRMMGYCNSVKGTPAEDLPLPKGFFGRIFQKNKGVNQ